METRNSVAGSKKEGVGCRRNVQNHFEGLTTVNDLQK